MYWTGFTLKGTIFCPKQCTSPFICGNEEMCPRSPPQSPDLNIIGNKWYIMQVKLSEDDGSIRTRAELVQRLHLLWRDITVDKLQEL